MMAMRINSRGRLGKEIPVTGIAHARRVFSEYRDTRGLTMHTLGGADLYGDGALVARFSYNGRCWNQQGQELTDDLTVKETK